MEKLNGLIKAKLIDDIEHQGIGGKYIILERKGTAEEVLNLDTIAAYNFGKRRQDIVQSGIYNVAKMTSMDEEAKKEYMKEVDDAWSKITCYYGHINNLGYFICEDEIVGDLEEVDWDEARKYI